MLDIDSSWSLQQGLDYFHKTYRDHLSHDKEGISPDAIAFFEAHDITHVLFDCDISLYGEGAVKIWTIFGTSLGFWKHVSAYRSASAFQLAKGFTFTEVIKNIFPLMYAIPTIIFRARKMSKQWDWNQWSDYLDTPIAEIRKAYNIHVL